MAQNYKKILESILGEPISDLRPLGGGCIAQSMKAVTSAGNSYFVKDYGAGAEAVAAAEAHGLQRLQKTGAIGVAEVLHQRASLLVLRFIETGSAAQGFFERFGEQLAQLHRASSQSFGFCQDNFIGSTEQKNTPQTKNWSEFFAHNRLGFQLQLAQKNGLATAQLQRNVEHIIDKSDQIVGGRTVQPALIHGDLWSGNFLIDAQGMPVIIDPACYFADREMEFAMVFLFGGFDQSFLESYQYHFPLDSDWKDRIAVYKLYHILNHLNIFGSGYLSQALALSERYQ